MRYTQHHGSPKLADIYSYIHISIFFMWVFPGGLAGKELPCNAGNLGSIPGLGRSPGEGTGYPLQYSGLENSMNCIVHGVAKSWTRLSDFTFTPWWLRRKRICLQYRRPRFDPLVGRSPGEANGSPLQYSCLENPMDRRAWRATGHRITKSQTQLSY